MTSENQVMDDLRPIPKRIIKNTLYNTLGNWTILLLNFLIVPYIITKLGAEVYGGVWVVGTVLIAYLGMFDFGIGTSSVKFIAEYAARGEMEEINKIVSTGIVFYGCIGLVIFTLCVASGKHFLHLIGVPEVLQDDAFFVLVLATGIAIMANSLSPLSGMATALQRMDITNATMVVTNLFGFGLTLGVLYLGLGVRGLIIGNFVVHVVQIMALIYWARRLMPGVRIGIQYARWTVLSKLWRYAVDLQVSRISQIIVFQTDRIVTLRLFGPIVAASYEVSVKVSSFIRSVPLVLASALLPVASELEAKNDNERIGVLFERASKYLVISGIFVFGFVLSETPLLLHVWIGTGLDAESLSASVLFARVLVFGYFLNMLTGVASTVAAGIGRTDLERRTGYVVIIVISILLFVLPVFAGRYGVAAATSLSLGVGAVYYTASFLKVMGKKRRQFWMLLWKPVAAGLIASAAVRVLRDVALAHESMSRGEGAIILGLSFVAYAISYTVSLLYLKTFDHYDISTMRTLAIRLKLRKETP